jgi:putative redox protein
MNEVVNTSWVGDMSFESDVQGFNLQFDSDEKFGGKGNGPRPKAVILAALAACTGMDVVSILKKKQLDFSRFSIDVDGEIAEEYPKIYKKIKITYYFTGKDFQNNNDVLEKINRAVRLSRDNYCAVSAMLRNSCEISDEIVLINS